MVLPQWLDVRLDSFSLFFSSLHKRLYNFRNHNDALIAHLPINRGLNQLSVFYCVIRYS